jgi:hypothetical protein
MTPVIVGSQIQQQRKRERALSGGAKKKKAAAAKKKSLFSSCPENSSDLHLLLGSTIGCFLPKSKEKSSERVTKK